MAGENTERQGLRGRLEGPLAFYDVPLFLPMFGLAFSMCWCYSSQRLAADDAGGLFQVWQYVGMSVGALLVALAARLAGRCVAARRGVLVATVVCGILCAPLVVLAGPWTRLPALYLAVAALDGAVVSWSSLAWASFYARLGVRQNLMCVCGMLVVSSVTKVVFDLLSHDALGVVALAALPAASAACLVAATRRMEGHFAGDAAADDGRDLRLAPADVVRMRGVLAGVFLIVLGVAVSMSIGARVFGLPYWARVVTQLSTVAIALVMLVSSYRFPEQAGDTVHLWFTAVLVIATGLAVGVLLGVPLGFLSSAVFTTAQMLVIGFTWFVLFDVAQRLDAPADVWVGLGWGVLFALPMALGLALPRALPLALDPQSLAVVVLWMLLAALAMMRQRQAAPDKRLFAGFSPRMGCADDSEARLGAVAREFGLTPREADIMGLYAQGRSRTFISAQLVISENTVRDHLKSIYRKLDVHNKQELIDLIGR